MFTGIITDIGKIIDITDNNHRLIKVACSYNSKEIDIGASIACSGVCLTVTNKGFEKSQNFFEVEVSKETDDKTTTKFWREGTKINLEKSLKVGDEIGGHFVYGHVDCLGELSEIHEDKNQTGNLIKQLEVFEGEERVRIKKQQPRLIKIKTMKQTEASTSKIPYQEENF